MENSKTPIRLFWFFVFLISSSFLMLFFFLLYLPSAFSSLQDLVKFIVCTIVIYVLWILHIPISAEVPSSVSGKAVTINTKMELCSVFMLVILPLFGPVIPLLAYALGTSIYYWRWRGIPMRPKFLGPAMNTFSYGASFLLFPLLSPLSFTQPFWLLLKLFAIILVQTIFIIFVSTYYYALLDNEKFLKKLWVRIQPQNIFVEALSVLLFPSIALIAILMWFNHYPLAVSFLVILFAMIYLSMRAFRGILDNLFALILAMMRVVEVRDSYTEWHCGNVAEYSGLIGKFIGLDETSVDTLKKKARIHDFGKILVPDDVLLAERKLTDEEFELMKRHTYLKEILINYLPEGFEITDWLDQAIHHHERWDGGGYPDHLKGEEIPFHARIMAVADAWDAMTTSRIYRKTPLTKEQALDELRKYKGKQWDPMAVDAFLQAYDQGEVEVLMAQLHASHRKQGEKNQEEGFHHSSLASEIHERNRSGKLTKQVKIQLGGTKTSSGMSFSYLNMIKDGLRIFFPFVIAFLLYLLPQVPETAKDFIFFAGLLLTMERWEFKNPLGFNLSYGEIVYIFALFVFPMGSILGLIAVGTLWRILSHHRSLKYELIYMCKRIAIFSLSSAVFESFGLRGSEAVFDWTKLYFDSLSIRALKPLFDFFAWMVFYGALQFIFLNLWSVARRVSNTPLIRQTRLWHFLFFNVLIFPILSYACYFLYAIKPMLFPYSFLMFLPVVFTTFILFEMYAENLNASRWTGQAISRAVDTKFTFTEGNSESIAGLSEKIATELGMDDDEVEWIVSTAFVHNIGRVGIHDRVLKATGPLSPEDFSEVESLCKQSVRILKELPFYRDALDIIESPHERWDGKGYPSGYKERKIPLGARIIAVADALVAMISLRPDRNQLTLEQAIDEIKAKSMSQFDPRVVEAIVNVYTKGLIRVENSL